MDSSEILDESVPLNLAIFRDPSCSIRDEQEASDKQLSQDSINLNITQHQRLLTSFIS